MFTRQQRCARRAMCVVLWGLIGGLGILVALEVVVDIDLALSARYYDPARGWFLGQATFWRWLYGYGEYPALVGAALAGVCGLGSVVRPTWRRYRRLCLFLILAVGLGPGVLVNGVLKPFWGRPRPRHVQAFGGIQPYRPWWRPGGPGAGASFPSGHAAMGYVLMAGALLIPAPRPAWWRVLGFGSALLYGTLLGYARVVQGGHFASDVLWAGAWTGLVVLVLYNMLWPPVSSCPLPGKLTCPYRQIQTRHDERDMT